MSKTITRGAVAAGDPRSVAAGLNALRNGGNAVDALLAAGLTAAVVETFLTGLGGGGVALVRSADDGVVRAHDFFATVPGLGRGDRPVPATTPVEVDYGVEVQVFHGGPASVAVPGIPAGFADLHRRYGRLPMEALVEPALHHARRGFEVDGSMTVVCELIAGVISLDPAIRAMFLPGGEVVARGTTLRLPELGDTLELFAREGARPFYEGEVAGAMLAFAGGDRGPLTAQDLRAYRARRREPLVRAYRDGELFLNPPPGAAGALLAHAFGVLQDALPSIERFDGPTLLRLARVMAAADGVRDAEFFHRLDEPAWLEALLDPERLRATAARLARLPATAADDGVGSTTHVSAVDADGWVAAYTSSNGETCGWMLPGTGVMLNNFLGEEDLQGPDGASRAPGQRVRTMMAPTLLRQADGSWAAMGTGGANRIRSAVLQGVIHLVDRGVDPAEAVEHGRIHHEGGVCRVELAGGLDEALAVELEEALGTVIRYSDRHMYFGGLHLARLRPDGSFDGAGDPRRAGAFGCSSAD